MHTTPAPVPQEGVSTGAGFWIRALARLIDALFGMVLGLFGGIVGMIALVILQLAGVVAPGWEDRIQVTSGAGFGLSMLGGFLYHFLCEGIHGATLGKLICRIRVIGEGGNSSSMKPAFIRGLGWYIDALFFGIVAYSSMQKSPLKQRYGDVWGKTVVVKHKDVPGGAQRSTPLFLLGLFLGVTSWTLLLTLGVILKGL